MTWAEAFVYATAIIGFAAVALAMILAPFFSGRSRK